MRTSMFRPVWLVLAVAAASCATVTTGTEQTIAFVLKQPGTQCTVKRGQESLGSVSSATASLKVQKHFQPLDLDCNAKGMARLQGQVKPTLSKEGVVGAAITLSSAAVDALSGALYIYPDTVTVDLVAKKITYPEPFQQPEQPPGEQPMQSATSTFPDPSNQ